MKEVKSIYFGMFQSIGDVVVSTSIIRAIKLKYPLAEITYAVGKEAAPIIQFNPDIHTIIECGHPMEVVLRSKEKPYDKVFLPLQLTQFDSVWHQQPEYCQDDGGVHNLVDFYASRCLDDLEITDRRTFVFPQESEWEQLVSSAAEKAEEFKAAPFITVHTTTRNVTKDWPYERFAELTQRISDKYKGRFAIYQIGGENDKTLPEPVKNLKGLPLRFSMSVIKHSSLNIGLDSGTEHLSDGLNVPTICIMGSSSKINSGPIGPNTTFIEPYRKCIGTAVHCPCIASQCVINAPCVNEVTVDEVFETVCSKLDTIFSD